MLCLENGREIADTNIEFALTKWFSAMGFFDEELLLWMGDSFGGGWAIIKSDSK